MSRNALPNMPVTKHQIALSSCTHSHCDLVVSSNFHYLTATFSVRQYEHRVCWQLGQESIMMLILVAPQKHFPSGELPHNLERGRTYTAPHKNDFLLAFRGWLLSKPISRQLIQLFAQHIEAA